MKLKEYIEKLQEIEKEHGDLDCIYAIDDEGNGFNTLSWSSSIGHHDKENREFFSYVKDDPDGNENWDVDYHEINSVCVN